MLPIIFEDNHIIAINKPAGMLSQADQTGDDSAIDYVKDYIKVRYKKPGDVYLGSIHRLDRPTSGAIMFARTSKALTRMHELIRKRKVEKTYLCITDSRPPQPEGELVHYLRKNQNANYVTVYSKEVEYSKKAKLHYRMIAHLDGRSLLEVELETGRPHQIRAQLSHIGCPIVGDTKYGGMETNYKGEICLHSFRLHFTHPVRKEPVTIKADVPASYEWKTFKDFVPLK